MQKGDVMQCPTYHNGQPTGDYVRVKILQVKPMTGSVRVESLDLPKKRFCWVKGNLLKP